MKLNTNTIKPFLPLTGLIILIIISFRVGFSAVTASTASFNQVNKEEELLSQKAEVLNEISDTLSSVSSAFSYLFPSSNPAVAVIYQLKSIGVKNGVIITNVKSGSEVKDKSGLFRVDINFDLEGPRTSVFNFINETTTAVPVIIPEKIKISDIGGVSRAQVSVKSFYAPLPTKIGTVSEKVDSLTPDETNLLRDLLSKSSNSFVELPASEVTNTQADPFNSQ